MANWSTRKKSGGYTITNTQNRGTTISKSWDSGAYRTTISNKPDGKVKITTTTRCGNLQKRETKTVNPSIRSRKTKVTRIFKSNTKSIMWIITLPFKFLKWIFK